MTIGPDARLVFAVLASVGLHTAALLPIRAPSAVSIATPLPQAFLNARLQVQAANLLEVIPDAPIISPVTIPVAAEALSQASGDTAKTVEPITMAPGPRSDDPHPGIAKPPPAPPQSSGEEQGQMRPGVRVALPDEVQVRVHLHKKGAEDNPNEVLQLESGKYFYFNAPQLKETARPLADAKPHYPTAKLEFPHGAVSLMLLIDDKGKLEKVTVLCANPAFESSALASIRDMQFGVARDANGPVKSYMMVDFGYGVGAPCGRVPNNLQLDKRPG